MLWALLLLGCTKEAVDSAGSEIELWDIRRQERAFNFMDYTVPAYTEA